MKSQLIFIIPITILVSTLICGNQTIEELDKEKEQIKAKLKEKNEKIEELNEELEEITKSIIITTEALNKKIDNIIKKQEELLNIQDSILSTEKILISLKNSISNINFDINKKEKEIKKQKNKIREKEEILYEIKKELEIRLEQTYDSSIKNDISNEEKIYLIDYYHSVQEEDLQLSNQYRKQKNRLKKDKENLQKIKQDLQDDKNRMKDKQKINDQIIENLNETKNKKEESLSILNNEKEKLKEKLDKKNNQKNVKKQQMETINSIISDLLKDKKRNEKIKKDLIEKRKQKTQIISKNFKEMKGRLQWPVDGNIITKFGEEVNEELNTKTENIGIEIKCKKNATAVTIMDGIVSRITFIPVLGNTILIDHGDDYKTIYSNIEGTIIEDKNGIKTIYSNTDDSIFVSESQYVSNKFKIGIIGVNSDGENTLHFQIWYKDTVLNPEQWLIKK